MELIISYKNSEGVESEELVYSSYPTGLEPP